MPRRIQRKCCAHLNARPASSKTVGGAQASRTHWRSVTAWVAMLVQTVYSAQYGKLYGSTSFVVCKNVTHTLVCSMNQSGITRTSHDTGDRHSPTPIWRLGRTRPECNLRVTSELHSVTPRAITPAPIPYTVTSGLHSCSKRAGRPPVSQALLDLTLI